MSLKIYIVAFVLIGFVGCQKDKVSDDTTVSLLNKAQDKQYPYEKRIGYAMQADTVATRQHNALKHLDCIRMIATLYLKQKNNTQAKNYFLQTIALAKELSDNESQAHGLNNIGLIYSEQGQPDSAIGYYIRANVLFRATGKQKLVAQNLVNMGIVYKDIGDYDQASSKTIEATRILETLNDEDDLASAYTNLGNIFKDLNDFDKSLQYHQKALQTLTALHDSAGIALALNNIGNAYRYKKDYPKALSNYFSSLTIKGKVGTPKSIAITDDNIGQAYSELKDYSKAERYFIKALDLRNLAGDKDGYLTTSNRLSRLYLETGAVKKAADTALKAFSLSPKSGLYKQRLENNQLLSEIYQKLDQNKQAIQYANNVIALKDSLLNSDIAANVIRNNARYESDKKDKELLLSKQLQTIQLNQIRTQWAFIILLGTLLLAVVCTSILLYRSYKKIKMANKKIEFLMSELNHRVRNNLQLVSNLLHLQLGAVKDSEQAALFQTSINRIKAIHAMHSLLYRNEYNGTINMRDFIKSLTDNLNYAYESAAKKFRVSMNILDCYIDIEKATFIGLIINELITNIYKYSKTNKENPILAITFTEEKNNYKLQIQDDCDAWDIQQSQTIRSGLGLSLIENLVKQLHGSWTILRQNNLTSHLIIVSK